MILMSIPKIKGDSAVVGYEKWIICQSMSWGMTREFAESGKAGTKDVFTGVAEIPPIEVGKSLDLASIDIMQAACGGGALGDKAQIHMLASGVDVDSPAKSVYLKFTLENPIIASWSISGDEDARPTESLTLWYWKIALEYFTFDGTNHKSVGSRGWDRVLGKKWSQ